MKYIKKFNLLVLISILMLLCIVVVIKNIDNSQQFNDVTTSEINNDKNNEWIIKWKSQYNEAIIEQGTILDWIPAQGIMRVKLNEHININEWINQWKDNPEIEYIQPNIYFSISEVPNDKYYTDQYYLQQIKAEKGWSEAFSREIIIAVLDTGIDYNHPDLQGKIIGGVNLLNKNALPIDDNGHGTNVAGIVAANSNNSIGISGITRNTKIMPIKVLDEKGEGDSFYVGQGIRYAVDNGANIVLLASGETIYTPFMFEAVNYAEENGILVVAAVGNKGSDLNYPAALPNVLAVGAVDSKDKYVDYSNYGQQIDVVAYGEGIFTTNLGGGYISNSGTSMAAPQVAGLAAFLYQKYPDLSTKQIADLIKFSADDVGEPGWDIRTGYGRINVEKALSINLDILKDGYESNNTSDLAHIFPLGDTFNAQLSSTSDVDWFRLILPYDGNITIDISLEHYLEHGVQLEFYFKEQIITDELYNPDILTTSQPIPYVIYQIQRAKEISLDLPKGEYYLKISYVPEEINSGTRKINYEMTNKYIIYQDNYEPNDRPWDAYKINKISEVILGTFSKSYDEDWYKIYIPRNGTLSAEVRVNTKRSDPVLWLQPVGGVGSEIDYNSAGKGEFGYLNVTPGEYMIRVSDYNNNIIIDEYELRLVFKSTDRDNYEPNDLSLQATTLSQQNHSIEGVIFDRKDYDWYKFEVTKPSYLEFNLKAENDIQITLFNNNFKVVWTNTVLSWDQNSILDEGTYYIRLNSFGNKTKYSYNFKKIELIGEFIDIQYHYAEKIILYYYEQGFVAGYDDHTFRPDQPITRAEVASIINSVLKLQDGYNVIYTDVSKENPNYKAILNVAQAGIMSGYEDKTFRPDDLMTPEKLLIIMGNINNKLDINHISKIQSDINTIPYASISRAEFLLIFDKVYNYDKYNEY